MRNDCLNIIHCTKDSGDLSSVKDLQSWKTLVRVAEIRQYAPIFDLTKTVGGEELPTTKYHRKRRNIFTSERDLDNICKERIQCNEPGLSEKGSSIPEPQQRAQGINEFAFSVTKLVSMLKAKMCGKNWYSALICVQTKISERLRWQTMIASY